MTDGTKSLLGCVIGGIRVGQFSPKERLSLNVAPDAVASLRLKTRKEDYDLSHCL